MGSGVLEFGNCLADQTQGVGKAHPVRIQSSQLGVSITDVLHQQAAQMREKRRQLAEIMARQATIKMLFPLAFFIFPAMFVVLLGPSLPRILGMLGGL